MGVPDFEKVFLAGGERNRPGFLGVGESLRGEVIPFFLIGKIIVVEIGFSGDVAPVRRVSCRVEPEFTLVPAGNVEMVAACCLGNDVATNSVPVVGAVFCGCLSAG